MAIITLENMPRWQRGNWYKRKQENAVYYPRKKVNLKGRITKMVKINDATQCWEWTGRVDNYGYGILNMPKGMSDLAHRTSFFAYNGSIDTELLVLHSCDNTGCVNPEHLRQGTHKDNTADMYERGREYAKPGDGNKFSKLKEHEVIEILKSTLTVKELSEKFNVSTSNIQHIQKRETWKHLII